MMLILQSKASLLDFPSIIIDALTKMLPAHLMWRCSYTGKPANPTFTPEAISQTRPVAKFSSAFPQQVENAIPMGVLTHLRSYWDTRGSTEACGYFPQHFLSEPT